MDSASTTSSVSLQTDYVRVRAQLAVLKRALVEEQTRSNSLESTLKNKEFLLRDATQKLDLLYLQNEALSKRIDSMIGQSPAPTSTSFFLSRGFIRKKQSTQSLNTSVPSDDLEVIFNQMESNAIENADLREQLKEANESSKTIHAQLVHAELSLKSLSEAHNTLLAQNETLSTQIQKWRDTIDSQKRTHSDQLSSILMVLDDWRMSSLDTVSLSDSVLPKCVSFAALVDSIQGLEANLGSFINEFKNYYFLSSQACLMKTTMDEFNVLKDKVLYKPIYNPKNMSFLHELRKCVSKCCQAQATALLQQSQQRKSSFGLDSPSSTTVSIKTSGTKSKQSPWDSSIINDLRDLEHAFVEFVHCIEVVSTLDSTTLPSRECATKYSLPLLQILTLWNRINTSIYGDRIFRHWRYKYSSANPTTIAITNLLSHVSSPSANIHPTQSDLVVDASTFHANYKHQNEIISLTADCVIRSHRSLIAHAETQTIFHRVQNSVDTQTTPIPTNSSATETIPLPPLTNRQVQTNPPPSTTSSSTSPIRFPLPTQMTQTESDWSTNSSSQTNPTDFQRDAVMQTVSEVERDIVGQTLHLQHISTQTCETRVLENEAVNLEAAVTGCRVQNGTSVESSQEEFVEASDEIPVDLVDDNVSGVRLSNNVGALEKSPQELQEEEDETSTKTDITTPHNQSPSASKGKKKKKNKKRSGNVTATSSHTVVDVIDLPKPTDYSQFAATATASAPEPSTDPSVEVGGFSEGVHSCTPSESKKSIEIQTDVLSLSPPQEQRLHVQQFTVRASATVSTNSITLPTYQLLWFSAQQESTEVIVDKEGYRGLSWDMERISRLVHENQLNQARAIHYERLLKEELEKRNGDGKNPLSEGESVVAQDHV
ncbi:hypothetical protein BDR26DRAFT_852647 [Obelidium mucronatum]|nr:hypothetical protein BDR26DRAFT_852647 [Obelidium mucronatum]